MAKTLYIQTDANTANLAELLLQQIAFLKNEISSLNASVSRLSPLGTYQLLSEEETAAILNIHKNTLMMLRNEQQIHFHKIKGRILYSVEDIREFEERCRHA
ncbi:MAG: helix-turn-helix domain-containing protein [Paludibacter sp.]|nr:helix-turn-helix domain-containing protein [Paludibacter sp.]